ncbi:hypothetical protein [Nonomuraea sp. NPDC049607]|uniref:hypothetical protein n=1 Tax=Nonomuraea sp. NPDC049607 TaxID=3154732 RepID=UPI00343D5EC5
MLSKLTDKTLLLLTSKTNQLHAHDCGEHLEWQLRTEISAEQVRQEEERAEQLFPHAVARFQTALQALPADQADSPFVQALVELVTPNDDKFCGRSGFIILPEWVDILDLHFPAAPQ